MFYYYLFHYDNGRYTIFKVVMHVMRSAIFADYHSNEIYYGFTRKSQPKLFIFELYI